jgi:hypothetical protein
MSNRLFRSGSRQQEDVIVTHGTWVHGQAEEILQ